MRVKHTIQAPGNDPVTYNYTRADIDGLAALSSVASLLNMDFENVPEASRPKTLAITIEF